MSIVVGWWIVPAATTVAALLWAGWSAHKDRGWLLAEVEKLTRERDEARAEVEQLRAENARLRAQIAEYFTEPETHPVERAE